MPTLVFLLACVQGEGWSDSTLGCERFDENIEYPGWDDPTPAGFTATDLLGRFDGAGYDVAWRGPGSDHFGSAVLEVAAEPEWVAIRSYSRPALAADSDCLAGWPINEPRRHDGADRRRFRG
jgi:hypothetical protein